MESTLAMTRFWGHVTKSSARSETWNYQEGGRALWSQLDWSQRGNTLYFQACLYDTCCIDVWKRRFHVGNGKRPGEARGFGSKSQTFKSVRGWVSSSTRPWIQHRFHPQHCTEPFTHTSSKSHLWKHLQNGARQAISHRRSERNPGRNAVVFVEGCEVRCHQMSCFEQISFSHNLWES